MLTPKQEKFAQCVASGMTQADAYRTAYDCKPETKATSIQVNASRLMADATVSQRVKELQNAAAEQVIWTRADSIRALMSVIESPDKKSDVTGAVKELNLMHGFNAPVQSEVHVTGGLIAPDQFKTAEEWESFANGE